MRSPSFSRHVLDMDAAAEIERIAARIREQVQGGMRKRGAVVAVSGGIDSSVVAGLCARALGPERVLALFLPERDSSGDSTRLGRAVAEAFGIENTLLEDIAPVLAAAGCYERQLEAIRRAVPDYGPGWKNKITIPSILDSDRLNISLLTVEDPAGNRSTTRMPVAAYLQLIAATNYKQRVRKMTEYYHADRLNYAVAGTPNRLEYDQGFFVKLGDGAADLKPIAHLYKTQVYALAEVLGVPDEVRRRTPTTDTFSLPQTQEEFYFALPYPQMDLCLWAHDHGVAPEECGPVVGLTAEQVSRVYRDIEAKRRVAHYLHLEPQLVEPVGKS